MYCNFKLQNRKHNTEHNHGDRIDTLDSMKETEKGQTRQELDLTPMAEIKEEPASPDRHSRDLYRTFTETTIEPVIVSNEISLNCESYCLLAVSEISNVDSPKCEGSTVDNDVVDSSKTNKTNDSSKVASCSPTEVEVLSIDEVVANDKAHREAKKYKCEECGKGFSRSNNLKDHRLIHTGGKPFKCEECGKSFSRKCHFKIHLQVHTGHKPHVCVTCDQRFSLRSTLVNHRRTHTGEKPLSCGECGRCFAQWNALHQHQRWHTGEKPFKCGDCDKAYKRGCSLKKHRVRHHGKPQKPSPTTS
jgi:uncharacterized Zn-finger protein